MRIKFNFLLLMPLLFSAVGCSKSNKISFKSDDFTFNTYYSDSYFLLDNNEVHEEIALASHAMALATFNGNHDYSKRSQYIRKLWQDEKFENIWFNQSFYEKPGTDTIGFGVASKTIEDFTLIAVAVRGGNYDGEWTSNLTLGEYGNAQGFDEASNMVIEGITSFIGDYQIEGHVKFWISGYSRAAITSNMTAGKILNKLNDGELLSNKVNYTSNDFYVYCFEPPMGVQITLEEARKGLYHGIHNYLNYNDFVPLVAPFEWGFVRYGTDHYYPDRLNDIYFEETEREKILSLYHFSYGAQNFSDYTVDKWKFFDVGEARAKQYNLPRESIHPSQGRFSRALIRELALTGIGDRDTYFDTVQDGLRDIMSAVMGLNPKIEKIELSNLVQIIFEYDFIKSLIMELEEDESLSFATDIELLFLQMFGANEENLDTIKDLYSKNFYLFSFFCDAFKERKDIMTQLLYRDNAMGIAIGHMPEVSYSFLSACDSRFYGKKACKLNDGSYKILHINQPTSFSLFEKNLKKDIFSYKDGVMTSDYISAEKLADGSLDIYLPNNGAYEYISDSLGMSLSILDPLKGEIPTNRALSPGKGEF